MITGYGPIDILWLDGGQVRPPEQDIDMPRLAAMARRHQPGLIVVDRTVGGRYENYRTPEQEVPERPLKCVWESCLTMGDQWSYKPFDKYKSTRTLIHLLVNIVSKGGNFLLNVGPDADGQFPPTALARLDEIGRWMRVNSAAIYGTRGRPLPRRTHPLDTQGRHDLPHHPGREGRKRPAAAGQGGVGEARQGGPPARRRPERNLANRQRRPDGRHPGKHSPCAPLRARLDPGSDRPVEPLRYTTDVPAIVSSWFA